MRRVRRVAFLVTTAIAVSGAGASQGGATDELEVDIPTTALVTGVATTAWALSEVFKGELAPSACRWCASNAFDDSVRDALVWDDGSSAKLGSDVIGYGLAPFVAIGLGAAAARHDGLLVNVPGDALVVAEATALAMDLNQLVKLATGRERPFVHQLEPAEKERTDDPNDNNLSFYSAHMTFTTALAASAGTVAILRGYRWAPLVWGVGLPLAVTAGYLRIAADKHYASDVIVGGVIGGVLGVGAPLLLHRRRRRGDAQLGVAGSRASGGAVLSIAGTF